MMFTPFKSLIITGWIQKFHSATKEQWFIVLEALLNARPRAKVLSWVSQESGCDIKIKVKSSHAS